MSVMDPDLEVDIPTARERLARGASWIDVRELDEWEQARIEGTYHHPLRDVIASVVASVPDRSTPLLVSCAAGVRSLTAVRALREAGYSGAVNVAGGIRAWIELGLPVVSGASPREGQPG